MGVGLVTELWRAPGPQPVQVNGAQVSYSGQAAADVAALIRRGLEQLAVEAGGAGMSVPPRYRHLLAAADQAAAGRVSAVVSPVTSSDVTNRASSAASGLEVVGLEDAARRLGRGKRTARRVLDQTGVRVGVGVWQIKTQDFEDQIEARRTA